MLWSERWCIAATSSSAKMMQNGESHNIEMLNYWQLVAFACQVYLVWFMNSPEDFLGFSSHRDQSDCRESEYPTRLLPFYLYSGHGHCWKRQKLEWHLCKYAVQSARVTITATCDWFIFIIVLICVDHLCGKNNDATMLVFNIDHQAPRARVETLAIDLWGSQPRRTCPRKAAVLSPMENPQLHARRSIGGACICSKVKLLKHMRIPGPGHWQTTKWCSWQTKWCAHHESFRKCL